MNYDVYLAPMAGVTDRVFRKICSSFGPFFAFTEMISAKALCYDSKKTKELLPDPEEGKIIVQLFGHEPETLAEGARRVLPYASEININMGCPMPKIVNNGDGSALMDNVDTAKAIVKALKDSVDVPVSVKFRKGIEKDTAAEFARAMEEAGADKLYVHARTRLQLYSGKADLNTIRAVKKAVNIPVVGNGDIFSAPDGENMIKETGCDAVMVGRGALGNPFIFREIEEYKKNGNIILPDAKERVLAAAEHLEAAVLNNGTKRGILESRKHLAWYLKTIPGSAKIREKIFSSMDKEEIINDIMSLIK